MKRLLFVAVLIILSGFSPVAGAIDLNNFEIKSFTADYYLKREQDQSATMTVKESIVAEFPSFDQNHGILRALPKSHNGHTLSLDIKSVTKPDGSQWQYDTNEQNDNLVLKIGDPDQFVRGEQTYIIDYQLRNVIDFYDNHDELFWDVNGDQWLQTFGTVRANIHIPNNLAPELQQRKICYAGQFGSTGQNCTINTSTNPDGSAQITVLAQNLSSTQTLSYVLGFESGTFKFGQEIEQEKRNKKILLITSIIGIVSPPIVVLLFMTRQWRKFGNDPKGRGVIIPEYQPPEGLDALTGNYLLKEKFENTSLSPFIIEMAVQRLINIYETKQKKRFAKDTNDYELELLKLPNPDNKIANKALEVFFGDNPNIGVKVKISELKKSGLTARYNKVVELGKTIGDEMTKKGFFSSNPDRIRNQYFTYGGIAFSAGVLIAILGGVTSIIPIIALGVGGVLAAIVIFIFAKDMPARTQEGVQALDDLHGLRQYIAMAEAERIRFGQSPKGAEKISHATLTSPVNKVKLFETLLPYAILFGLEKQWAEQFKDIYKTPPEWYTGNISTFNAVYMTNSLGSFSSQSQSSFTPPSSSGGSGFSGGGAGGGGGGGGGGGW